MSVLLTYQSQFDLHTENTEANNDVNSNNSFSFSCSLNEHAAGNSSAPGHLSSSNR